MNLSNRLQALADQGLESYAHIWDCCCDHGLLGQYLMQRYPQAKIHFVDQVREIMDQLHIQLEQDFPNASWSVYCEDLNRLVMPKGQGKHLIIIAGVGGDLTFQFIESLLCNNQGVEMEFLLCPIRQHYWLRTRLRTIGLRLINEQIVSDKGRFYELLHLSSVEGDELSCTGDRMWNLSDPGHREYLAQILNHYEKMKQGRPDEAAAALTEYQQLYTDLSEGVTLLSS